MKERDLRTAERFGLLERCQAFEKDLLQIDGVLEDCCGVDFDLSGWESDIRQVIIVPKYDWHKNRAAITRRILEAACKYGLRRTNDRIEDYGEHIYMVLEGWEAAR